MKLLSHTRQVVLPRAGLSATTTKVIKAALRNPRVNQLKGPTGTWDADKTLADITRKAYYGGADTAQWPAALRHLASDRCQYMLLHWLRGSVWGSL